VNSGWSRRSLIRASLSSSVIAAGLVRESARAEIDPKQLPGKIAFVRGGSIWVWSGGGASELLSADNISDPRWNPDGTMLLYVRMQNSYSDLYTYDLETGLETQITYNQPLDEVGSFDYATNSSWVLDPDWARSGLIGFMSDAVGSGGVLSLWLLPSLVDAPYLALQTVDEDDISGLCLAPHDSLASYTVRVRMGNGQFTTYVALRDLNNGVTNPVAQSSGDIFDSAISPDGAWVAVTIRDGSGVTDIWLVDRATGERRRGTRNENAMAPRWSDDGAWFTYLRMRDYEFEIWAGGFSKGRIRDTAKIYGEDGLDSQSGLTWWMPTEESQSTPTS
jgi:dipeptidyl aminopeptidase/acylaminoacyl peptidase